MTLAYILWIMIVSEKKTTASAGETAAISMDIGMEASMDTKQQSHSHGAHALITALGFAIIVLADVFIKLGSIANGISIDRDWLPVLAPTSAVASADPVSYDLTHLNAVMRRINLICKLLAPLAVNLFVSKLGSYRIGILVLLLGNLLSWATELWFARQIFDSSASLIEPKVLDKQDHSTETQQSPSTNTGAVVGSLAQSHLFLQQWKSLLFDQTRSFHGYFSTVVWVPSLCRALLHLSVLAFTSSLITYFLEIGFSLNIVTIARTTGSGLEVASTIATPWAIHHFSRKRSSKTPETTSDETESPNTSLDCKVLENVGLCGVMWQFWNAVPAVIALFVLSSHFTPSVSNPKAGKITSMSLCMVIFLALSRAGLWMFDLPVKELTQTLVPKSQLSSFAGVQQSFVSSFELTHWILTATWGNPRQFPWLALASLGALGTAAGSYFLWVFFGEGRRTRMRSEKEGEEGVELLRDGRDDTD